MTFEQELEALLNMSVGALFENIEKAVKELHRKHGREVPPAVVGEIGPIELPDAFR